jgi:hypothetical protein
MGFHVLIGIVEGGLTGICHSSVELLDNFHCVISRVSSREMTWIIREVKDEK